LTLIYYSGNFKSLLAESTILLYDWAYIYIKVFFFYHYYITPNFLPNPAAPSHFAL